MGPSPQVGAVGDGRLPGQPDRLEGVQSPLSIAEGAAVPAVAATAISMLVGSLIMALASSDTFSATYVAGMAVCLLGTLPAVIGQLCARRLAFSGTAVTVMSLGRTHTYVVDDLQSAEIDSDGVSLNFGRGVLKLRRAAGGIGPWLAAIRPLARHAFADVSVPAPDPVQVAGCLGLHGGQGLCCRLTKDRLRVGQLGMLSAALLLAQGLAFWSLPGTSLALVRFRVWAASLTAVAILLQFWRACPSTRWSVRADADGLELRLDDAAQRKIPWSSVECVWCDGPSGPWIETACGHVVLDGGDANCEAILTAAQLVAAGKWCRPGGD